LTMRFRYVHPDKRRCKVFTARCIYMYLRY
jgi:hypothetical protein